MINQVEKNYWKKKKETLKEIVNDKNTLIVQVINLEQNILKTKKELRDIQKKSKSI
jgi:hypothetical protein